MANYVDNAKFLEALKEHKAAVQLATENGTERPRLSNYIGKCILDIATHLSYRPNFINYTFREEMIGDGYENCLMYVDNFDPSRFNNPFAYFTQIIYFAFIRRIQKEKKQTLIKGKIIMDMPFDAFDVQEQDEDGSFVSSYVDFMQNHGVFDDIIALEQKRKAKAKERRKKQATLEDILVESEEDAE